MPEFIQQDGEAGLTQQPQQVQQPSNIQAVGSADFSQLKGYMDNHFMTIKGVEPALENISNYNELIAQYKNMKASIPIIPKNQDDYNIDTKGLQVTPDWIKNIKEIAFKNKLTQEQAQLLANRDIDNYANYVKTMEEATATGWKQLQTDWGINFDNNKSDIESNFFKRFNVPDNMKTPEHYKLFNEIRKLISDDTLKAQSSVGNNNKPLTRFTY